MVPGGGVEPPTRGFSVHCSTTELPGHARRALAQASRLSKTACPACPYETGRYFVPGSISLYAHRRARPRAPDRAEAAEIALQKQGPAGPGEGLHTPAPHGNRMREAVAASAASAGKYLLIPTALDGDLS